MYCMKLSHIFSSCIDEVMRNLGYCCGQRFTFSPQSLLCYGNRISCAITPNSAYYLFSNPDQSRPNVNCDKYTYCQKCFDSIKLHTVSIGDDPVKPFAEIKKELFSLMKNDHEKPEQFVDCNECGRKWHQICALHYSIHNLHKKHMPKK